MLIKKKDLPAMPFYFGDWRKAPEIRALDLDIRMIWFEMLGYMWESTERGYLTINGNSVTTPVIARLIGIDTPTMEKAMNQLEKYNVFSKRKSDGAIYCRKMITDEELRIKKSIAGQKGMESRYSDITPVITKPLTSPEDETENEDVNVIYNKWNDKKIIVHNKFTDDIKARIISKNKDYTTDQIIEAIDNYAIILNGDYYFKYKWTLKDFLQRGIDKFLNLQIAKDNYKSKPINNGDGRGVKRTHAPLSKERQEEYSKL